MDYRCHSRRGRIIVLLAGVLPLCAAPAAFARPEVAKLTPSDGPSSTIGFGRAVAISGDYIAVGAPKDDPVDSDDGSVYVFKRQGLGWVEQVKLIASNAGRWKGFGTALAMEGNRLVVGAPGTMESPDPGTVYVFRRDGETWMEEAILPSPGDLGKDAFGAAVAIHLNRIVIGATADEFTESRVYVYRLEQTDWVLETILTGSDVLPSDFFGLSVSIDGDTLLVGAPAHDHAPNVGGAAYVFRRVGIQWSEEAELLATDTETASFFGVSV